MSDDTVTLYGLPHSVYTGRARSYLIKAGIPYRETSPKSRHFQKNVIPKAGGRFSLPTLELPSGEVIRDGVAIMDHFEAQNGHRFSPSTPKQNLFSCLIDVIGAEGLLRPLMHYRWHFDDENLEFLRYHFRMVAPKGERGDEISDALIAQMQKGATPSFGALPDCADVVEAVYIDQLKALDRHLAKFGYLFGGRPSIGDFGLIIPLFAHLGRDPVPLALMQREAMCVFRWVERMNRPTADLMEFENEDEAYLPDDQVPETLIEFLKAMSEDFVPETLAAADSINAWLAEQDELPSGTPSSRSVGMANFELRGKAISAIAQPFRFYLLQRVQDAYHQLDQNDREHVDALLAQCNMTPLLAAKLDRPAGFQENTEVWL